MLSEHPVWVRHFVGAGDAEVNQAKGSCSWGEEKCSQQTRRQGALRSCSGCVENERVTGQGDWG